MGGGREGEEIWMMPVNPVRSNYLPPTLSLVPQFLDDERRSWSFESGNNAFETESLNTFTSGNPPCTPSSPFP